MLELQFSIYNFSQGRQMHNGRFYNDSKEIELTNKIKKGVQEIRETPENKLTEKNIERYTNKLKSFKNSKHYPKVSQKTKNEVDKTLKKLRKTTPSEIKMDVEEKTPLQPCLIQIPSYQDIVHMSGMSAGNFEDQSNRLNNMVKKINGIQSLIPKLPIVDTDKAEIPDYWQTLFESIQSASMDEALQNLEKIPQNDRIFTSLMATHSNNYIKKVIMHCMEARKTGLYKVNNDIVFTPKTFEIFIKDLATTLLKPAKICFSFGLPSHHAYYENGAGFCMLNKTAALIHNTALMHDTPIKYIIIGTDVNRDDGLCSILMNTASHLDVHHVDIFDSRVYPYHNQNTIKQEFKKNATVIEKNIQCCTKELYMYFSVDLSLTPKFTDTIHPALKFALQILEDSIKEATEKNQQIALFLPTGWDSHIHETANCSKVFGNNTSLQNTRFNDTHLSSFYESLFELYRAYNDLFIGMYWGLEGGYHKPMYENQIQLTLEKVYQHALISCYADISLTI